MPIPSQCPVCDKEQFEKFIDFGIIPRSGTFSPVPDTLPSFTSHSFEFCLFCALILKHQGACEEKDYQIVNRSTQKQMPLYTENILNQFFSLNPSRADLIVDVGGNDGAFLNLLANAGFKRLLNIEPSLALAEICRKQGHCCENVSLDLRAADEILSRHGFASTIFCRHVLEHVADPVGFLSAIRKMLNKSGRLFLETPDARGIFEGLLAHELWDEHLFHFDAENLSQLLEKTGFRIDECEIKPHRGGTNILIWARPANQIHLQKALKKTDSATLDACKHFAKRWSDFSNRICKEAQKWSKPIICLGASHPQTNYCLFTKLGAGIDYFVDDDPLKIGKYVPVPRLVPVLSSPELLAHISSGTIIRSAFGCDHWMDHICKSLPSHKFQFIEPYLDP
jgi:2-polyprenyl-3-methyl-5-hydroxy-6-metoxy-1,4-benzoquinol methylase